MDVEEKEHVHLYTASRMSGHLQALSMTGTATAVAFGWMPSLDSAVDATAKLYDYLPLHSLDQGVCCS